MNLLLDKSKKYVVGYSTGVDSTALLHFLATHHYQVRAICCEHSQDNINLKWENLSIAQRTADKLNIHLTIIPINFSQQKGGMENNARYARYSAIANSLKEDEVFLTAHHNSDLIETVFLQMFRGTGLSGIAGMKTEQALHIDNKALKIVRPLLHIEKEQLVVYANEMKLEWYEDYSNRDTNIKRNYLRLDVLPKLKEVFQGLTKHITKLTQYIQEAEKNLMDLAEIDVGSVVIKELPLETVWDKKSVKSLSKERMSNLIRYYFKKKYQYILSEKEYQEIHKRIYSVSSECIIAHKAKLKISNQEIVFEKLIVC